MKKQHRIKTIFTLAAAVAAGIIYASSQSSTISVDPSDPESIEQTSANSTIEEADSLSPGQIAVNAMTEEYKLMKEQQYEGEEESAFYPRIINLYLTASKALELAENEEQKMQVTSKLFLYHQGVIKRLRSSNKSLTADDKKIALQAPLCFYNLIFKQKLNVSKW